MPDSDSSWDEKRLRRRGLPMSSWHVMLLLDNCPGHGSVSFMQCKVPDWGKIELLPPNTTSIIQPCDGGAIMKLKRRYRRHLLRHIHASA